MLTLELKLLLLLFLPLPTPAAALSQLLGSYFTATRGPPQAGLHLDADVLHTLVVGLEVQIHPTQAGHNACHVQLVIVQRKLLCLSRDNASTVRGVYKVGGAHCRGLACDSVFYYLCAVIFCCQLPLQRRWLPFCSSFVAILSAVVARKVTCCSIAQLLLSNSSGSLATLGTHSAMDARCMQATQFHIRPTQNCQNNTGSCHAWSTRRNRGRRTFSQGMLRSSGGKHALRPAGAVHKGSLVVVRASSSLGEWLGGGGVPLGHPPHPSRPRIRLGLHLLLGSQRSHLAAGRAAHGLRAWGEAGPGERNAAARLWGSQLLLLLRQGSLGHLLNDAGLVRHVVGLRGNEGTALLGCCMW